MALLTVAQFRAALGGVGGTTLDDASLQIMLDAAEEAIIARRGPVGALTETRSGGLRVLFLSRPAATIASVSEYFGTTQIVLGQTDWYLRPSLMSLTRLISGVTPAERWADRVVITYTPVDDTAERKRVQLALVKLDLAYSGYSSISTQTESRATLDYLTEREAVLDSFVTTTEMRY